MAYDDLHADGDFTSDQDYPGHGGRSAASSRDSYLDEDYPSTDVGAYGTDFSYSDIRESLPELSTSDSLASSYSHDPLESQDLRGENKYSSGAFGQESHWREDEDSWTDISNSASYVDMMAHNCGYSLPENTPPQPRIRQDYQHQAQNTSQQAVQDSYGYYYQSSRPDSANDRGTGTVTPPQRDDEKSALSNPDGRSSRVVNPIPSPSSQRRIVSQSPASAPQGSSYSSGAPQSSSMIPGSLQRPEKKKSGLSALVIDNSARRKHRHSKVRQASRSLLRMVKNEPTPSQRKPQSSRSHPRSAMIIEEIPGAFMTRASWVLMGVVGLLTMFYWHLRQLGDDWASLWIAGLMVRNDQLDNLYDRSWWDFGSTASPLWSYYRDSFGLGPWPHPFVQAPVVVQFTAILTRLMNYYWSLHLLAFLTGAALVLAVISAHYIWKKRPLDTHVLVMIVVLVWVSEPVLGAIYLGQTTPILFALLLYGLAVSDRHPYAAGIALAVATIVKLSPIVVIGILLFFVSRRRAAVSALVALLLMTVISVAFIGPRVYATWLSELRQISSEAYVTFNNQSMMALAYADRASDTLSVTTIAHPAPSIKVLGILFGILLFLVVLAAASQLRERACEILCVGSFVAFLLSSNIYWVHYAFIAVALYLAIFILCPSTQKYLWPLTMVTLVCFYSPMTTNQGFSWYGGVFWGSVLLLILFCIALIMEAQNRSSGELTVSVFFRNIKDFLSTLLSQGTSGTTVQSRM